MLLKEIYSDMETTRNSYTTHIFAKSDSLLFQDFNIEIKRKINKKLN